jgi:tetratricopeptide (TPR) repeat protein
VALPPLAQAAPSAPSPPPAASAPSPTQAVVAPTTAPAKTKRPAHHPAAAPITGLGAEALDAGFQSFKRGDYISAGIEAKRAARQGAGTRAFLLLGDSMMHLQSYAEAQQAYQSAIELEPGSAKARLGLRQAKQKAPR